VLNNITQKLEVFETNNIDIPGQFCLVTKKKRLLKPSDHDGKRDYLSESKYFSFDYVKCILNTIASKSVAKLCGKK